MSPRVMGRVGRGNPAGAPAASPAVIALADSVTIDSLQSLAQRRIDRPLNESEMAQVVERFFDAMDRTLSILIDSTRCDCQLSDLIGQLQLIALLSDELIYSDSSSTSSYFRRWWDINGIAETLLDIVLNGNIDGVERLIRLWSERTIAELQTYFFGVEEEGGEA